MEWLFDLFSIMYEYILLSSLLILIILKIMEYIWSRRKHYLISLKLPGPVSFPIIGNAYAFLRVHPGDIFKKIEYLISSYSISPLRFWLGPDLIILYTKPSQVEKILLSTKLINKPIMYDTLKDVVGNGLITGSGIQWKVARKHVQPLFGIRFVSDSIGISNKQINRFMEKLMSKVNQPEFDLLHAVHSCVADIIGESILGIEIGAQRGKNQEFTDATIKIYDIMYTKLTKPWYKIDVIWELARYKFFQNKLMNDMYQLINKAADQVRKIRRGGSEIVIDNFKPAINDLDQIFMENCKVLDYQNYLHNLLTLYMASEDTVAQIASAVIYCLGMYPEYQEKCAEEIALLVGKNTTNITYEDVLKLDYLDMCVKETLRLFPIAPFIARKVVEDVTIDDLTLPPNVTVMISIFSLHFDPEQWKNPMEFYPDHFSPDEVEKRHPYSFIPFSSGPRGCIGQLYAYTCIKVMVINILQRFNIEAEGKYVDIYKHLKADISVRSKIGFPIKLKSRKWKTR